MTEPSRVLNLQYVGAEISEEDLAQLVTNLVMVRTKSQALLKMQPLTSAISTTRYFKDLQSSIKGRNVYIQELITSDMSVQPWKQHNPVELHYTAQRSSTMVISQALYSLAFFNYGDLTSLRNAVLGAHSRFEGRQHGCHSLQGSYARSEGEEYNDDTQAKVFTPQKNDDVHSEFATSEMGVNGGMHGMANTFSISAQTALSITTFISMAALVLQSLRAGVAFKIKALSYLTLLLGLYMAWNIGTNARGTLVRSGALNLRQAVMAAALLEFTGALLIGSQKGILVANVFDGKSTLLFSGISSTGGKAPRQHQSAPH